MEERGRRRRRREHATECPKPLEQGIFLVDWAIHSRHVTLNFFHYKTLLPSPLQRQIACTYFTQWNIASPLKQSFSSQSLEKKLKQWLVCKYILWEFCFANCTSWYFIILLKSLIHVYIVYNVCASSSILMCPHLHCRMAPAFAVPFLVLLMWYQTSQRQQESICYCQPVWGFDAEVRVLH